MQYDIPIDDIIYYLYICVRVKKNPNNNIIIVKTINGHA